MTGNLLHGTVLSSWQCSGGEIDGLIVVAGVQLPGEPGSLSCCLGVFSLLPMRWHDCTTGTLLHKVVYSTMAMQWIKKPLGSE